MRNVEIYVNGDLAYNFGGGVYERQRNRAKLHRIKLEKVGEGVGNNREQRAIDNNESTMFSLFMDLGIYTR